MYFVVFLRFFPHHVICPHRNIAAGVKCAAEGGTCSCTGLVQYGVGTSWTAPRDVSGQVACNNNQFGDPRQGKVKACYCLSGMLPVQNTCTEFTKLN